VPAGAYDIAGPETTSYADLLRAYARIAGKWRAEMPLNGIDTGLVSWLTSAVLPMPGGLAGDLVESLDHPMMASDNGLRDLVSDPAGGLVGVDDSITRALTSRLRAPVDALADPHHLADTDPVWAGGDTQRLRQLANSVTPSFVWPVFGLLGAVPGPVSAAVRTGLDTLIGMVPKARTA
jgi:hypothetical protein